MGFEPTRSKTLRPERNPLDHSGKLTGSPLAKPHITKNTPVTDFQTQTTNNQQPTTFNANTLPHRLHTRPRSTRPQYTTSLSHPYILHHRLRHAFQLSAASRHTISACKSSQIDYELNGRAADDIWAYRTTLPKPDRVSD